MYSIIGSIFFGSFHSKSFWLLNNGNGGFVGKFLSDTFLGSLIFLNENISYPILILTIISLFLLSTNFSVKSFFTFIKNLISAKKNFSRFKSSSIDVNLIKVMNIFFKPVQENFYLTLSKKKFHQKE